MADNIQRISGTSAKIAARLCNFVTAQYFLLLPHQEFLDKEVAPVIRGLKGPWVDLFDYASRAGEAGFNQTLSQDRLEEVKQRIGRYANEVSFHIQTSYGDSLSGPNERNNDGYWRAVEVYVYGFKPPQPDAKAPTHTSRIISRSFSKLDATPNLGSSSAPDIQKDAINDLLKVGIDAAKGKFTAEGLLGKEDAHEASPVPEGHRVNKVTINTERSLDQGPGGSTVQETTKITYLWGPPAPNVIIEKRFQFTWNKQVKPPINETITKPRSQAESTPLVVPPDP